MLLLVLLLGSGCPAAGPAHEGAPRAAGERVQAAAGDADGDGSPSDLDCDDTDGSVFPGAAEACNAVDDDCDGEVDGAACGCTYATDGRHTFQLCATASTWAGAAATCAGWGYHLADVDDATEDAWLWAEISALPVNNWWFGFNDLAVEGTFAWDGGSDSPYTHWRAGEPNDFGGGEDCAWYAPTGAGEWNDKDCAATAWFVCEAGCTTSTRHPDADGDGYGDPATSARVCADEPGYVDDASDCDDADPAVHPDAGERCDAAVDEDCDGLLDDADPDVDAATFSTFYPDADGDGFAGSGGSVEACAAPPGFAAAATDCDDSDATTFPGALDTPADGLDQDCDGADTCTWYADDDGDGWGDETRTTEDCAGAPAGHVAAAGDCDDTDGAVFPGATDPAYDGVDSDCAGDDDDDADGDGAAGEAVGGADCDDTDPGVYPGAAERCDGVDEDCDGELDGGAPDCPAEPVTYADHSYLFVSTATTWSAAAAACASVGYHLADVHEAAEGAWLWGVAEPLDSAAHWWHGYSDREVEGTFQWDGGSAATYTEWRPGEPNDFGGNEDCGAFADDGAGAWNDRDCAQSAPYVCEAGCERVTVYTDADGDGFGDAGTATEACELPAGTTLDATDCDDTDPAAHPGGQEVCDEAGADEDCDGAPDDLDPSLDLATRTVWYADLDRDGYGVTDDTRLGCHAPAGFTALPDDCDDTDPTVHPGAPDPDDGVDQGCDGGLETWDGDGDGLPDDVERALGLDPDAPDSDDDGRGDALELGDPAAPTDTDGDGTIDPLDDDDDGDGLPTAAELGDPAAPTDTDGDGTIDALDLDSDDDGTADAVEAGRDSDHDGIDNAREVDDDGDGRDSAAEDAAGRDPDGDGVPSSLDLDSDGDGCPDAAEPDDAWLDDALVECPTDSGLPAGPGDSGSAPPADGCGCAVATPLPAGGAAGLALLLALGWRRRRGEKPASSLAPRGAAAPS